MALFFDYTQNGNLIWFSVPFLIFFFVTLKKRKRWEVAIAAVFILSCISLSVKGIQNPRYVFTLIPFTLIAVFLLGWEFINKKRHPLQIGVFIICLFVIFYNFFHFREFYTFYWQYKVSAVDDHFPHEIVDFINNYEDFDSELSTMILSNRHIFFYHTDRKGIYYKDHRLTDFYAQQKKETAFKMLINQVKVKYIFLNGDFNRLYGITPILNDIITYDCDLMFQDNRNGFLLYEIRDAKQSLEELEKIFVNNSLLQNGSLENWSRGSDKKPDFFEGGDNVFEGMAIQEENEVKVGQYSAKITGDNFNFTQVLTDIENLKGKQYTCFVWIKTDKPDKYRIKIDVGKETGFSRRHSGSGEWELLQANLKIDLEAESIVVRIISARKTGNVNDVVYVDGALMVEGDWNTFYLYRKHLGNDK